MNYSFPEVFSPFSEICFHVYKCQNVSYTTKPLILKSTEDYLAFILVSNQPLVICCMVFNEYFLGISCYTKIY